MRFVIQFSCVSLIILIYLCVQVPLFQFSGVGSRQCYGCVCLPASVRIYLWIQKTVLDLHICRVLQLERDRRLILHNLIVF